MAEKRYYWLKLHKDFFKRHEIRIIEDMPNGKDYILFYLKLLVESVTHEGALRFSDAIPYNEQMLATITNTNVDIVKAAMQIFIELHMIELLDDQTIFMAEVAEMIGSEAASTIRSRKCRDKQKTLQGNNDATLLQQNCNTENRDKRIENRYKSIDNRDKDNKTIEKEKNAYGEFQNVKLTEEEYRKITEQGLLDVLEELSGYIASTGKKYKSHYATILNWKRRKEQEQETKHIAKKGHLKSKPTYDIDEITRRTDMGTDIDDLLAEFD